MPKITMPKLSDTMTEGTLLRWCKQKGDAVDIGDLLAEVETDKATMEMEAFEEGTLSEIYVEAGGKVAVGAPIALILGKDEKAEASAPATVAVTATSKATSSLTTTSSPSIARRVLPPTLSQAANISSTRIKASPLARKIATQRGLSLETVAGKGTGPGGRIIAADVINAPLVSAVSAPVGVAGIAAILPTSIVDNPETEIPLTGMRQTIAQRLLASKTHIPHFYLSIEIDAAPMMSFRKEFNSSGEKITFNDIILLAAARAVIEKPKINAAFGSNAIFQYEHVNLAVAIAVEDGLVTPVIRSAQNRTLQEISAAVKDLAIRARNKKLKPEEYAGGTLTVSNLGAYGIEQFFGIINPPQAAILAVGAIVKKPVVDPQSDAIVVGHRLILTLSGDHRVVDGAVAAEYLATVRKLLETPSLLVL
ncbi:MAG: 2-oxo acid dehydrogenase subunit E2 [Chthoniobacterales bacterium]|nr:2-oxo acid dehydrogenase subunit E2 [Chthoniobacterales bacterium]